MQSSDEQDNVVPFPGTSSELESAALWLTRLDRGLSAAERSRLGEWLARSPTHGAALEDLATFWGEQHLLAHLPLPAAVSSPRRARISRAGVGRSLAALFLVAAMGLGAFTWLAEFRGAEPLAAVPRFEQTFVTAIGERATEVLPDGSTVTLNTNTEVHVVYQDRDRIVDLRHGEAQFNVAHDVERPFGVRAAGRIVQAVGTAFNVRIQEAGEVEIIVTEGVVQILEGDRNAGSTLARDSTQWWTNRAIGTGLVRGQVALLSDELPYQTSGAAIPTLEPEILDIKLAWQQGVLIFEGEPLTTVLREFGRYTTTEFVIDNAELGEVRVGGYFETGNIDALLESLRENFQIRAEHVSTDRVLLLPAD